MLTLSAGLIVPDVLTSMSYLFPPSLYLSLLPVQPGLADVKCLGNHAANHNAEKILDKQPLPFLHRNGFLVLPLTRINGITP